MQNIIDKLKGGKVITLDEFAGMTGEGSDISSFNGEGYTVYKWTNNSGSFVAIRGLGETMNLLKAT